jgi:hypothetical protein
MAHSKERHSIFPIGQSAAGKSLGPEYQMEPEESVAKFTANLFPGGAPVVVCPMTETMIAPAPRMSAPASPSPCEIATLPEAARALRMMDRELALLRREHQCLTTQREQELSQARLAALAGVALGGCGLGLALVALLTR